MDGTRFPGDRSKSHSDRELASTQADIAGAQPGAAMHPLATSRRAKLSLRVLLLTILFVMIAEVLIYVPSIANFRNVWLQEKLDLSAVATLAASAANTARLAPDLERDMLASIDVEAIAIRTQGHRWLLATHNMPEDVSAWHDLTQVRPIDSIRSAFGTLLFGGNRMVMVAGRPPPGSERFEILINETKLRNAMLIYSRNILFLSLAISIITAGLVYMALNAMIVRPIQRLTRNMVAFSEEPEDPARIIRPSARNDELGVAEEQLAMMQNALRETLRNRRHLADLGLAVSKINHDLRNILASAQLFSERLAMTDDPMVRRVTAKLVGAIDRAINYSRSVLAYGQAREAPPARRLVALGNLCDDVAEILGIPANPRIEWENRIPPGLEVDADPDQLFRVLMNLLRNAAEALEQDGDPSIIRRLWLEGERAGSVAVMRVCDTGPGVPAKARAALFQAFQGSARPGGTGLGLAIAAEIIRAHGGEIVLVERPGAGAIFQITLPDRPVDIRNARQAKGA